MQKLEKPAAVTVDLREHTHGHIVTLWKEQRHTDVVFLVGEEKRRVCAHRAILACQSDYFETLLFGEMLEAKKEEIALVDIAHPDLFVSLVEYAYTGKLEITDGKIQDVLDAMALADRFGFTKLKDSLSEALAAEVTLDNVLTLLVCGDLYQASSILNKCLDLIDKNALEILGQEEFFTLTPSTLQLIISRDTFFTPEMSVYQAVIHWKDQNSVSKEELGDILGCVRLSEISARELFTTIEPSQMFEPAKITTALRIQIKPEFQNRKPRGKKELGKNVFEFAKFASSGNVEYSGSGIMLGGNAAPPKITDGVIDLDTPRKRPTVSQGGSSAIRTNTSLPVLLPQQPNIVLGGGFGGMQIQQSVHLGPSSRGFSSGGSVYVPTTSTSRRPVHGGLQQLGGGLSLGGGVKAVAPSTKMVELSDIYLINTITVAAFPTSICSAPLSQWQVSYKIKISKNKETWETLFDFSEVDCYFNQTLRFPTQAVRYIDFELVSCGKPLKLKFINCSLEETKPFKFLDKGIPSPLELHPVEWFQAPELPPGHPQPSVALAVVLNTPVSMGHLRFTVYGVEESAVGDVSVLISRTWDYSLFKAVGNLIRSHFGSELEVDFEEAVTSYILIHLRDIRRAGSLLAPLTVDSSKITVQGIQCRTKL